MNKVRAGEPLRISAHTWNDLLDMVRWVKERKGARPKEPRLSRDGTVLVSNASGVGVSRFGFLRIDQPLFFPKPDWTTAQQEGAQRTFENRRPLKGIHAVGNCPFVILQEPLADGALGNAVATGVSAARVYVTSATQDYRCANPRDADTLELVNADGQAEVLWKETLGSLPGVAWALVRMRRSLCAIDGVDDECECCGGKLPEQYYMTFGLPACFGLGESITIPLPYRGKLTHWAGFTGCLAGEYPGVHPAQPRFPTWVGYKWVRTNCCVGGEGAECGIMLSAMLTCCGSSSGQGQKLRLSLGVVMGCSGTNTFNVFNVFGPYDPSCYSTVSISTTAGIVSGAFYGAKYGGCGVTTVAGGFNLGTEYSYLHTIDDGGLLPPFQRPPIYLLTYYDSSFPGGPPGCPTGGTCKNLVISGTYQLFRNVGEVACCVEQIGEDEYGNPIYGAPAEFNLPFQLTT